MDRSASRQPTGRDSARYEIRLAAELDDHWSAWFDGLTVCHTGDGTTVLSGRVSDQAVLHGLLQRVRDLGVPLVSVKRTDPSLPDYPRCP